MNIRINIKEPWKGLLLLAVCGAIGGLASYAYAVTAGTPPRLTFPWNCFAYSFIGTIIAVIFIEVIIRPDKEKVSLRVALALACGLFWAPIYDVTKTSFLNSMEKRVDARVTNLSKKTTKEVEMLSNKNPDEISAATNSILESATALISDKAKITDHHLMIKAEIATDKILDGFGIVYAIDPEVGSYAFLEITKNAIISGQQDIANSAVVKLSGVTEKAILKSSDPVKHLSILNDSMIEIAKFARLIDNNDLVYKALLSKNQTIIQSIKRKGYSKDNIPLLLSILESAKDETVRAKENYIAGDGQIYIMLFEQHLREINNLIEELEIEVSPTAKLMIFLS